MRRHRQDETARPTEVAQTFFVLDADSQPTSLFHHRYLARTGRPPRLRNYSG